MSLAHFQDAMVRLITDPDFRDQIAAGNAATDATLSDRETTRLQRIARDPGLGINRTLHKGFRLGKLRGLLPFTCRLLGTRRLCDELARFWRAHPPASFYFLPEAVDFCDYLRSRKLRLRYLDEVIAYERATLERNAPASARHRPNACGSATTRPHCSQRSRRVVIRAGSVHARASPPAPAMRMARQRGHWKTARPESSYALQRDVCGRGFSPEALLPSPVGAASAAKLCFPSPPVGEGGA